MMMRRLLVGLSMMALLHPAMAATLVVVQARGIALKPGTALDDGKNLVLKQGQHVTLISETGATLKLDGPYNRLPAGNGGQGVDLSQTMKALITQRQARAGEYGTTRGTTLAALPDPWLLDASHGGNGCLREGQDPVFWRPDASHESSLTVAPVDRSWKARARWPTGLDQIGMTPDVPMRSGETYSVDFNGDEFAVTIILVPGSLMSDAMRAAWMADQGCTAQAEALMKTLK
jgi:hypothetical protein